MSQQDFFRKMAEAIAEMARKKEQENFVPKTQSDYWQQMVEAIKSKEKEIISRTDFFSKSAIQKLVDDMKEKIEQENKEKLDLYSAALNKTGDLICKLFQEIDKYVHSQTVNENMPEINSILDELSPEISKRDELIELIRSIRNQV